MDLYQEARQRFEGISPSSSEGGDAALWNNVPEDVRDQWYGPAPTTNIMSYDGGVQFATLRRDKSQRGFIEGITDWTKGDIPFLGDWNDAADIASMTLIQRKIGLFEKGKGPRPSDEELVKFNAFLSVADRKDKATWLGVAGDIMRESIQFGAELIPVALTGGGGGVGLLEWTAGKAAGKTAKAAGATIAREVAAKALRQNLGRSTLETAARVADFALGTNVKAAAADLSRMAAGGYSKTFNENLLAQAMAGKDEDRSQAAMNAFLDFHFENSSEFTGEAIGNFMFSMLPKNARNALAKQTIYRFVANKYNSPLPKQMAGALKRIGYDGMVNEMAEERLGGFMKGLFGVQGDDEGGIANAIQQGLGSPEQWASEAVAFALPGLAFHAYDVTSGAMPGLQADRNRDVLDSLVRSRGRAVTRDEMNDTLDKIEAIKAEEKDESTPWYMKQESTKWLSSIWGEKRKGSLEELLKSYRLANVSQAWDENEGKGPGAGREAARQILLRNLGMKEAGTKADADILNAAVDLGGIEYLQTDNGGRLLWSLKPRQGRAEIVDPGDTEVIAALNRAGISRITPVHGARELDVGVITPSMFEDAEATVRAAGSTDPETLRRSRVQAVKELFNIQNDAEAESMHDRIQKVLATPEYKRGDVSIKLTLPTLLSGTSKDFEKQGIYIPANSRAYRKENGEDVYLVKARASNNNGTIGLNTWSSESDIAHEVFEDRMKERGRQGMVDNEHIQFNYGVDRAITTLSRTRSLPAGVRKVLHSWRMKGVSKIGTLERNVDLTLNGVMGWQTSADEKAAAGMIFTEIERQAPGSVSSYVNYVHRTLGTELYNAVSNDNMATAATPYSPYVSTPSVASPAPAPVAQKASAAPRVKAPSVRVPSDSDEDASVRESLLAQGVPVNILTRSPISYLRSLVEDPEQLQFLVTKLTTDASAARARAFDRIAGLAPTDVRSTGRMADIRNEADAFPARADGTELYADEVVQELRDIMAGDMRKKANRDLLDAKLREIEFWNYSGRLTFSSEVLTEVQRLKKASKLLDALNRRNFKNNGQRGKRNRILTKGPDMWDVAIDDNGVFHFIKEQDRDMVDFAMSEDQLDVYIRKLKRNKLGGELSSMKVESAMRADASVRKMTRVGISFDNSDVYDSEGRVIEDNYPAILEYGVNGLVPEMDPDAVLQILPKLSSMPYAQAEAVMNMITEFFRGRDRVNVDENLESKQSREAVNPIPGWMRINGFEDLVSDFAANVENRAKFRAIAAENLPKFMDPYDLRMKLNLNPNESDENVIDAMVNGMEGLVAALSAADKVGPRGESLYINGKKTPILRDRQTIRRQRPLSAFASETVDENADDSSSAASEAIDDGFELMSDEDQDSESIESMLVASDVDARLDSMPDEVADEQQVRDERFAELSMLAMLESTISETPDLEKITSSMPPLFQRVADGYIEDIGKIMALYDQADAILAGKNAIPELRKTLYSSVRTRIAEALGSEDVAAGVNEVRSMVSRQASMSNQKPPEAAVELTGSDLTSEIKARDVSKIEPITTEQPVISEINRIVAWGTRSSANMVKEGIAGFAHSLKYPVKIDVTQGTVTMRDDIRDPSAFNIVQGLFMPEKDVQGVVILAGQYRDNMRYGYPIDRLAHMAKTGVFSRYSRDNAAAILDNVDTIVEETNYDRENPDNDSNPALAVVFPIQVSELSEKMDNASLNAMADSVRDWIKRNGVRVLAIGGLETNDAEKNNIIYRNYTEVMKRALMMKETKSLFDEPKGVPNKSKRKVKKFESLKGKLVNSTAKANMVRRPGEFIAENEILGSLEHGALSQFSGTKIMGVTGDEIIRQDAARMRYATRVAILGSTPVQEIYRQVLGTEQAGDMSRDIGTSTVYDVVAVVTPKGKDVSVEGLLFRLQPVIDANATIVLDAADAISKPWNKAQLQVAKFLKASGYERMSEDDVADETDAIGSDRRTYTYWRRPHADNEIIEEKPTPSFDALPHHVRGRRSMAYAVAISKDVPREVMSQMSAAARRLEARGYTLRAGETSDAPFKNGVKEKVETFGPVDTDADPSSANYRAIRITREVHPAPGAMDEAGQAHAAHYVGKLFGKNLNRIADFVLVWTADGAESSSSIETLISKTRRSSITTNRKREALNDLLNKFAASLDRQNPYPDKDINRLANEEDSFESREAIYEQARIDRVTYDSISDRNDNLVSMIERNPALAKTLLHMLDLQGRSEVMESLSRYEAVANVGSDEAVESQPVDSPVVRSVETGGAGQLIDMAARKGVPVVNMANEGWANRLRDILNEIDAADVNKEVSVPEEIEALKEQRLDRFDEMRGSIEKVVMSKPGISEHEADLVMDRLEEEYAEDPMSLPYSLASYAGSKEGRVMLRAIRARVVRGERIETERSYSTEVLEHFVVRTVPWLDMGAVGLHDTFINAARKASSFTFSMTMVSSKLRRLTRVEKAQLRTMTELERQLIGQVRDAITMRIENQDTILGGNRVEDVARIWDAYAARSGRPNFNGLVQMVRDAYDKAHDQANETLAWMSDGAWLKYLEGYVNHQYSAATPAQRAEVLKEFSARSKQRRIPSYNEAYSKFGLIPITLDASRLMEMYARPLFQVMRNRMFFNAATLVADIDGLPEVLPILKDLSADKDMIYSSSVLEQAAQRLASMLGVDRETLPPTPHLALGAILSQIEGGKIERIRRNADGSAVRRLDGSLVMETVSMKSLGYERVMNDGSNSLDGVWVKAGDARKVVDHVLARRREGKFAQFLDRFNAWSKFLTLSLSMFHPFALIESYVSMYGISKDMPLLHPVKYFRSYKETLKKIEDDPALGSFWAEHGMPLEVVNPEEDRKTLVDDDLEKVMEWAKDKPFFKYTVAPGFKAMKTYKDWFETFMWKQMMPGFKCMAAEHLLMEARKAAEKAGQPFDLDKTASDIAQHVNNALGGQEYARYLWANPRVRQVLQWMVFAPDWTLSAANVAGATSFPILNKLIQPNISTYGWDQMYRKYWPAMIGVTLVAIPNAIQSMIYVAFGNPDDGDHPWLFENEPGKRTWIDFTPIYRKMPGIQLGDSGKQRRYMRWGKQAYEVFEGWYTEPAVTALNKSSAIVRTAIEQMTGHSTGGFKMPFYEQGFTGLFSVDGRWLPSRTGYVAQKFIPMNVLSYIEERPSSFIAPMSKGVSRGTLVSEMQDVLETYADGASFARANRDKKIVAKLDDLMPELIDAGYANGVDPKDALNQAKNAVLGAHYLELFRLINNGASKSHIEEEARAIIRLNGTVDKAIASFQKRQQMYDRSMTEQQKATIISAFK